MAKVQFRYGEHEVTLEAGEVARQADGAVLARMGDTMVLVTVVAKKEVAEAADFFPLTVNYQERTYAAGRIPGGFFKREGRPSEKEILFSRLIDRPVRPLFPEGFFHEVQIIATVISYNPDIDTDVPSLLGASAALRLAGLPMAATLAAARVAMADGRFILNPTITQIKNSPLDLVVAGTRDAVLMVEAEARQVPEETLLEAIFEAQGQFGIVVDAVEALASEFPPKAFSWKLPQDDEAVLAQLRDLSLSRFQEAYSIADKQERQDACDKARKAALTVFADAAMQKQNQAKRLIKQVEQEVVRHRILEGLSRIDGRSTRAIRPISIRPGFLPRTHGSCLFTRGETQALVVATLGTSKDEQVIDALSGEYTERFMLHYNFPPYCVGETGLVGSPKRREIGHGKLARKAISGVMPSSSTFDYTLRVVSEITESNGSSSMATVCGTSVALMDAGVPLSGHVAGIAMGLVKEGNHFSVLSDILGDEDHLGDMDFKVAGTSSGVTALQMDMKTTGINKEIMRLALSQAREGLGHILGIMAQAIPHPRSEVSRFAPRITVIKVAPEKIRDIIGKGGSVIRALCEATGTTIEVADDGTVKIAAITEEAAEAAKARIVSLTGELEVGQVLEGTVTKIFDFGALVAIAPGKEALVHVSQIAKTRVNRVEDHLSLGQKVRVKVMEPDEKGRARLSIRALLEEGVQGG